MLGGVESCGVETFAPKVLEELMCEIANLVVRVFNKSINSRVALCDWRIANTVSVFKKGRVIDRPVCTGLLVWHQLYRIKISGQNYVHFVMSCEKDTAYISKSIICMGKKLLASLLLQPFVNICALKMWIKTETHTDGDIREIRRMESLIYRRRLKERGLLITGK